MTTLTQAKGKDAPLCEEGEGSKEELFQSQLFGDTSELVLVAEPSESVQHCRGCAAVSCGDSLHKQ